MQLTEYHHVGRKFVRCVDLRRRTRTRWWFQGYPSIRKAVRGRRVPRSEYVCLQNGRVVSSRCKQADIYVSSDYMDSSMKESHRDFKKNMHHIITKDTETNASRCGIYFFRWIHAHFLGLPTDTYLYKFGRTTDRVGRYRKHCRDYGEFDGASMEEIVFVDVPEEELVATEHRVRVFFEKLGWICSDVRGRKEIVQLPPNGLDVVKMFLAEI